MKFLAANAIDYVLCQLDYLSCLADKLNYVVLCFILCYLFFFEFLGFVGTGPISKTQVRFHGYKTFFIFILLLKILTTAN